MFNETKNIEVIQRFIKAGLSPVSPLTEKRIKGKRFISYTCGICKDTTVYWADPTTIKNKKTLGCKQCAYSNAGKKKKFSNAHFIKACHKKHGERFEYPYLYEGMDKPFTFLCKKHGLIKLANARTHLDHCGCRACYTETILYSKDIIQTNLKKISSPLIVCEEFSKDAEGRTVKVYCPIHKKHSWVPIKNLRLGRGCSLCNNENKGAKALSDDIILKYLNTRKDVALVDNILTIKSFWVGNKTRLKRRMHLRCTEQKRHPTWWATISDFINFEQTCPSCSTRISKLHQHIIKLLKSWSIPHVVNDRKKLDGLELDIFCPEHNIAIEINGLAWHSTKHPHLKDLSAREKDSLMKYKHRDKTKLAAEKGIRLIHILDVEWWSKPDVFESYLKNVFVKGDTVFARNTTVRQIETSQIKEFYNKNHIQGYKKAANIHLGLFAGEELVQAISFVKNRYSKDIGGNYELARMASCKRVVGGASKLLAEFKKSDKPKKIVSFCDLTYFTGTVYEKLGFTLEHINTSSVIVLLDGIIRTREAVQKKRLAEQFPEAFDATLTEVELCEKLDIPRYYGAGTARWVWQA
jgi:DNA-directed RNA polymerase subunit RPC12/RpoP